MEYVPTVYAVRDNLHFLKTSGRCPLTDSGIAVDWGASGIAFYADCEGEIKVHYQKPTDTAIYFTVYIDGVRSEQRYTFPRTGGKTVIATGLSRGPHLIEIYKQSQIEAALLCEFTALEFSGRFLEKPRDSAFRIEFVGDSITAGVCNLGINGKTGAEPEYSDTTQTYAFLAARELRADFAVIAQGGAAFTPNTGTGVQMAAIYEYTDFVRYPDRKWAFQDNCDLVVVNLGTNDFSKTAAEITKYALELSHTLRTYHPDAAMIFCSGMMNNQVGPLLREMAENLGGEGAGFYYVRLPQNNEGSGTHPNAAGNAQAADVLVDFIRKKGLATG